MQIIGRSSALPHFEVAPELVGYEWIEIEATPADSDQLRYDVVARIEPQNGRYVVVRISASQTDGGPPIQRGELAKISLEPFVRFAAATDNLLRVRGDKFGEPGAAEGFWSQLSENGATDDDLEELAHLYRWIRLAEPNPTAVLAEELKRSRATVKRWLARAVELGYLGAEERM